MRTQKMITADGQILEVIHFSVPYGDPVVHRMACSLNGYSLGEDHLRCSNDTRAVTCNLCRQTLEFKDRSAEMLRSHGKNR